MKWLKYNTASLMTGEIREFFFLEDKICYLSPSLDEGLIIKINDGETRILIPCSLQIAKCLAKEIIYFLNNIGQYSEDSCILDLDEKAIKLTSNMKG